MSVYVIAGVNITNPTGYQDYGNAALTSLAKFGVKALAVSDAPVALEGASPYGRYVLLEFPDQATAQAWYDSPEYQAAVPLRQANAETGFLVAVPGLG
ncbi:MAG: DUF1330 domain-containing protein [Gammaproteobacteria bacterium]|nr:DUF1330 domain-containing protein [Gammaproteobacteria bacterium]